MHVALAGASTVGGAPTNALQLLIAAVLVAFLGMTGFVLYDYGPLGWIEPMLANSVTRLAVIDLLLTLCVAAGFMIKDARQQSINVAPYLALTVLTGSAGPLAYLIRRLVDAKAKTPPAPRR